MVRDGGPPDAAAPRAFYGTCAFARVPCFLRRVPLLLAAGCRCRPRVVRSRRSACARAALLVPRVPGRGAVRFVRGRRVFWAGTLRVSCGDAACLGTGALRVLGGAPRASCGGRCASRAGGASWAASFRIFSGLPDLLRPKPPAWGTLKQASERSGARVRGARHSAPASGPPSAILVRPVSDDRSSVSTGSSRRAGAALHEAAPCGYAGRPADHLDGRRAGRLRQAVTLLGGVPIGVSPSGRRRAGVAPARRHGRLVTAGRVWPESRSWALTWWAFASAVHGVRAAGARRAVPDAYGRSERTLPARGNARTDPADIHHRTDRVPKDRRPLSRRIPREVRRAGDRE